MSIQNVTQFRYTITMLKLADEVSSRTDLAKMRENKGRGDRMLTALFAFS